MDVGVIVAVAVIARVIVAALVNGNDAVAVVDAVNEQPAAVAADIVGMLHFQKLDVYQRSIEFLAVANRIRGQLPTGNYEHGIELLERIVAMLTKLVDP